MSKNIETAKECGAWYAPTTDNITFPSRKELDVYTASVTDELHRQNAMLVEALQFYANECHIGDTCGGGYYGIIDDSKRTNNALQATSAQSAAWLEASHIEWMKGLPIARYLYRYQTQDRSVVDIALRGSEEPTESIALYAIPTKKVDKT